jgi:hypothetical protein
LVVVVVECELEVELEVAAGLVVVEVGVEAPPELQAAATSITAPRAAPTSQRDDRAERGMPRPKRVPMSLTSFPLLLPSTTTGIGHLFTDSGEFSHPDVPERSPEGEVVGLHPRRGGQGQ